MVIQNKTKEELIKELQNLQQEYNYLRASLYEKDITGKMDLQQKVGQILQDL